MGRSVPTYREELDRLILEWNKFKRCLNKEEREAFHEMMARSKRYTAAGQYQANPDPTETLLISVLLEHHLMLKRIERRLKDERMHIGHIPGSSSGTDDHMAEDE